MTLFIFLFFPSIAFMFFSNIARKKGRKKIAVFTATGSGFLSLVANAVSGKFAFITLSIWGTGGAEAALFACVTAYSIFSGEEEYRRKFYFLYYVAMVIIVIYVLLLP